MRREPVSFLMKCDGSLNILNVIWLSPVHLVSPYQKSLKELFNQTDANTIAETAREAFARNEDLTCAGSYKTVSPEAELAICIIPIGDNLLIHAIEASLVCDGDHSQAVKDLIGRFLVAIKATDAGLMLSNTSDVRNQFEKIQKLNNDLLNVQRQLKKANSLLNKLNVDLNNRLVKDALTGLVSRYQYRQEMEQLIACAPDRMGIFTFIDLDDFKSVNDSYGHRAGDIYLREFANRLMSLPFDNKICMRIAGDEFGLYLHGYDEVHEGDLAMVWDAILSGVTREPIKLEAATREIRLSAGMSVYGMDTEEIYDLIEYADFAMYKAKRSGKNTYRRFDIDTYREEKSSNSHGS